jgi:hypothetical protein
MASSNNSLEKAIAQSTSDKKNERRKRSAATKCRRRTRPSHNKTCPSITTLDLMLPRPLASSAVLRISAQTIFRYLLCTRGFSPYPIEQVLSSNTAGIQQHRVLQKMMRLRQQIIHFEQALHNELHSSHVKCILLSCGTSFARPRTLYWIDATSLLKTSAPPLEDEAPLARKVVRTVLQHDDTATMSSTSSPRQQLYLSIGIVGASAASPLKEPANWIHRREWSFHKFLQMPCSRPPTVCHVRILHNTIKDNNPPDQLTWFSLQSTIKPVMVR